MSAADAQSILSDFANFAGLVSRLQSPNNHDRKVSEDVFAQLCSKRADAVCANLVKLINSEQSVELRYTSTVLLRKFTKINSPKPNWSSLSHGTKLEVRHLLLEAISSERDRRTALMLADVVSDVDQQHRPTKRQNLSQRWPQLLTALSAWLQAPAPHYREAALKVMGALAGAFKPILAQAVSMMAACLAPGQAPEVQAEAVRTMAAFLEDLDQRSACNKLLPLVEPALTALAAALAATGGSGHMQAAEGILVALVRAAEADHEFWRPKAQAVVHAMMSLASDAGMGPDCRKLAVEFVMTLIDLDSTHLQGVLGAQFPTQFLTVLAHFLLDVEDEPGWATDIEAGTGIDDDDTLGPLFHHGLECMDRLADSELGGAALVSAAELMAGAWGGDTGDWRKRHAVYMCLGQIMDKVAEEVLGHLGALAATVARGMQDPHPRVRWSACQALCCMAPVLGPALLRGHAATLLPALAPVLNDTSNTRVQAHAFNTLRFCADYMPEEEEDDEGSDAKAAAHQDAQQHKQRCNQGGLTEAQQLLQPYFDALVAPLLATLASPAGPVVLRAALMAGAHLSSVAKSLWLRCYAQAMPLALGVLEQASEPEQAELRAAALECVSFMTQAAGRQAALAYLPRLTLILALVVAQACDLDAESPLLEFVLSSAGPLSHVLGPDMGPLLPVLLPLLSTWARADASVQPMEEEEEDDDSDEGNEDDDECSGAQHDDMEGAVQAAPHGQGKASGGADEDEEDEEDDSDRTEVDYCGATYTCSRSTAALKEVAVDSLAKLAKRCGAVLAPHAPAVVEALTPCLKEYVLVDVHQSACEALPHLVKLYRDAAAQGTRAAPASGLPHLLTLVWQGLSAALAYDGKGYGDAANQGMDTAASMAGPQQEQEGEQQQEVSGRAGMVARADLLTAMTDILDSVEPGLVPQQWVGGLLALLRQQLDAAAAHQLAAEAEGQQGDGSSDDDDEMKDDAASEDIASSSDEDIGSGDEEEEEEEEADSNDSDEDDDGDSGEDESVARERLRQQVGACVAALSRKYGETVRAAAEQILGASALSTTVSTTVASQQQTPGGVTQMATLHAYVA